MLCHLIIDEIVMWGLLFKVTGTTPYDDMHRRKIDLADYIYVINVGGYIGESTRVEIEYAEMHDKEVKCLEYQ